MVSGSGEDNNASHPDPHPLYQPLYEAGKLWMNTVALET